MTGMREVERVEAPTRRLDGVGPVQPAANAVAVSARKLRRGMSFIGSGLSPQADRFPAVVRGWTVTRPFHSSRACQKRRQPGILAARFLFSSIARHRSKCESPWHTTMGTKRRHHRRPRSSSSSGLRVDDGRVSGIDECRAAFKLDNGTDVGVDDGREVLKSELRGRFKTALACLAVAVVLLLSIPVSMVLVKLSLLILRP